MISILQKWLNSGEMDALSKANFEDVQYAMNRPYEFILMNTLSALEQDCLIQHTLHANQEETAINEMLTRVDIPDKQIILYGRNANDPTPYKKYKQITGLGVQNVRIYSGGLFEWLLLQDIYGTAEFPTTKKTMDLLKYK